MCIEFTRCAEDQEGPTFWGYELDGGKALVGKGEPPMLLSLADARRVRRQYQKQQDDITRATRERNDVLMDDAIYQDIFEGVKPLDTVE